MRRGSWPLALLSAVFYFGAAASGAASWSAGAALAAGLASAQAPLLVGALVSALCALIAAVVAQRHPVAAKPNRVAFWLAVAACAVVVIEPPLTFVFLRVASPALFVSLAFFAALGAVAALFASRGASARSLLIAAGVAAGAGVEAWLVLWHFRHFAMFGR